MTKFHKYIEEMCGGSHDGKGKKKRKRKRGMNESSGASIHTNKDIEAKLRKAGFDIPMYPKQGDVTLNGKKVGRMDNFTGLVIYYKDALDLIKKTVPKVGIWNPNKAK